MIYIPFSVIALNCPLKGSIKYPQAQNNSFSRAFSYLFSASRVSSPLIVELSTSTVCLWLGTLSFIEHCLFQISGAKHVLLAIKLYLTHGIKRKHIAYKAHEIHSPDKTDQIQFFKNALCKIRGVTWKQRASQTGSKMTKWGWFKFTSQEVLRLIFHVVLWNVCVHPKLVPRRFFGFVLFFLSHECYGYMCPTVTTWENDHLSVCLSSHALKNISNATDQTLIELTGTIQVSSLLKHHCLNIPHNVWNAIFLLVSLQLFVLLA